MIKFDTKPLQNNIYTRGTQEKLVTVSAPLKNENYNNSKSISFKAQASYNDFMLEQIKESKQVLQDGIKDIYKKDRLLLNSAFFGDVPEEKNKFSKAGLYYNLKQKKSSQASNVINNISFRKFVETYNDFYCKNLLSSYDVIEGNRNYLDNFQNKEIKREYFNSGNLDKYFENKLDEYYINSVFDKNGNQEEVTNKAYFNSQKIKFTDAVKPNPLLMNPKDLSYLMQITDNMLSDVDSETFNKIYNDLDSISEALHDRNKGLLISSFDSLVKKVIPYWEKNILTPEVLEHEKNQKKINSFIQSKDYQVLNHSKKMDLIFEYSDVTDEEKVFIVEKFNSDKEKKQSTTVAFLDFLNNTIPSSSKKKSVIESVIKKNQMANENFEGMKAAFIEDVRSNNEKSNIHAKKLDGVSILNRVTAMLPYEDDYALHRLNRLTTEDLGKLLDTLKPLWIDEKYKEACDTEERKYDISDNFEDLNNQLRVKLDGKDVAISEFLEKSFESVFKRQMEEKDITLDTLKKVAVNQELLVQNNSMNLKYYTYIMNQMCSIVEILSKQNKEADILKAQVEKVLDKLEIMNPNNSKDITYVRSTWEKLKDGLFNKQNMITGAFAASTGIKTYTAIQSAGAAALADPSGVMLALMALLYTGNIISNVRKEFKKQ